MRDSRISRGAVEGGAKRVLLLIGAVSLAFCITGCSGLVNASKGGNSTSPTVTITAPASGAKVSGTITISAKSANTSDSVQFQIDGSSLGTPATTVPYTTSLKTTTLVNGNHTLTAVATDTSNNKAASAPVTINVQNSVPNQPTVSIVSPQAGAIVSNTITVTAAASGSQGIANVQFQVDGSNLGTGDTSSPYSQSWDTTKVANGSHALIAVATDTSNNKVASAPVTINVQNSVPNQPTVSITSPRAGTIVSNTITVTAAASDTQGIANVQFQVDGSNLGTGNTSSPYSQSWDTTKVADGTHVLTAVATSNDSSHQPASASAVVTVNNSGTGPILSATPGWHKVPGTALCGGPENASLSVPDNFPNNINSNYLSYRFSFNATCESGFEDSSGAVVDTTRNRIIFWQGGHSGYWGNDVFDFEANNIGTGNPVLLRLNNPANPDDPIGSVDTRETLAACNYVAGCTPTTNSPGSRHTYNNLVYIPSTDQMTSFGGGLTTQGNASSALWTLNMNSVLQSCAPTATNQQGCDPVWTNATPSVAPPGGQINFINYDPNIGQVWGIYGNNSIWLYNPANNTYSQHGSLSTGYHNFSVLDPVHKLFITAGSDGIHYFDVSNPANTNITFQSPTVTGCSLLTGGNAGTDGQYPGMVWDPVAQQVVAYPNGGNALVILDPITWTCTTETYGSRQGTDYPQNTIILSGVSGTFGHFQYISAYDIFVLCNDPNQDCWYLRRNR